MSIGTVQLDRRPLCELGISKYCTKEAIMFMPMPDGKLKAVCHYCYWLHTHKKEWQPKVRK